jgi:CheY-like chemotaxis protein
MPNMDGVEAIEWIRNNHSTDLPIIALTALAMTGDREKCLAAGANDYLSKPIKLKQLEAVIQQFLE